MVSHPLFELLARLDAQHISYSLARHRQETVLVSIVLLGERLEVDVFEDGHMEFIRFIGDESVVGDREALLNCIERASAC